ncbi:class III extradiol ring-cleavage dioxygenase [Limnohabitans sp.]|jgi:4,5-DOPA dioxygenase extradiol|uniref:dioxygenase family protein n=1 Tax=Limnohabitans sp. TaxID=1907725 RepID=UPI00311E8DE2
MNTLRNVLFVPHGSPMFALQPGAAGSAMSDVAARLTAPRAIVVVSPHWETAVPTVGTATRLETIHDFGGFDARLFQIQYPATGCPEAAQQVVQALQASGLPVDTDANRGLDHGAWVPLRQMFPDADVPVVPLSVQHHGGPVHAYRVGQALAPLAEQGFLIVASGNVTHNLRDWQIISMTGQPTPDYVQQFADWIHAQMIGGQADALLNYRQTQTAGSRAHPRDEHLLPLFTALGAAGPGAQPQAFYRGIYDHVIAMDGYTFH